MLNFIIDPMKNVKQSLMHVSKEAIQDILWWKHNIIGAYGPIVTENPSV